MTGKSEAIALAYLDAAGKNQLDRLSELVAQDVSFVGPMTSTTGRDALVAALKRISAVHVENEIKRVFSDGNEVCVIYDFVTDTMGKLPTIEWLQIDDGKIRSIKLYYDQVPWLKVREELARRT
jgi:hypothetical protein